MVSVSDNTGQYAFLGVHANFNVLINYNIAMG